MSDDRTGPVCRSCGNLKHQPNSVPPIAGWCQCNFSTIGTREDRREIWTTVALSFVLFLVAFAAGWIARGGL